jgi:hypothetical protein
MHILGSWLARHEGHPAVLVADGPDQEPDWRQVADRAIALRADELDFDAWRKSRDSREEAWDEPAAGDVVELETAD